MKRAWILVVCLGFLTACGTGVTAEPVSLSPAPPPVPSPASAVPEVPSPTARPDVADSPPSDFFSQMQIDLPAPVCDGSLTPAQTEGPYYKAGAPQRNSLLEPDMPGQRLIVVGYVLGRDCRPIPNAWLDFWQADAQGVYDNQGFILRGHQFTDAQGRYFLETVLPGKYPGRPQHIHLKIQPPGGAVFTSQLYFPQEPVPGLTAQVEERQEFLLATFNFVVE